MHARLHELGEALLYNAGKPKPISATHATLQDNKGVAQQLHSQCTLLKLPSSWSMFWHACQSLQHSPLHVQGSDLLR
jgi:hypothetical protein